MAAIRLIAVLAILALGSALGWKYWTETRIPVEPLPPLSLIALEGREGFDLETLDGAYILNVWGSWCAPCRIEHPVLMALEAEGYPIYGINWRDTPEDANRFLDEMGNPFRGVMRDADNAAITALQITGAPETLVISAEGNILVRWPGPITADILRNQIYPALEREARRAR
jgi:cytochrome c biogenesis protein CcmG/thiol:disulfide interchange protein DsbE